MKQILLPALLVLAACSPAPATGPEAAAQKPAGPHAFEVQLTLTPRTIEKLGSMKEQVTVAAMYWGEPSEAATGKVDEIGQINLGRDDINVQAASRMVAIPGAAIDPKVLAADVKGPPLVLINVFTARLVHPDNMLDCGIFEGPISMAQQKPVEIECDLLEAAVTPT